MCQGALKSRRSYRKSRSVSLCKRPPMHSAFSFIPVPSVHFAPSCSPTICPSLFPRGRGPVPDRLVRPDAASEVEAAVGAVFSSKRWMRPSTMTRPGPGGCCAGGVLKLRVAPRNDDAQRPCPAGRATNRSASTAMPVRGAEGGAQAGAVASLFDVHRQTQTAVVNVGTGHGFRLRKARGQRQIDQALQQAAGFGAGIARRPDPGSRGWRR